MRLCILYALRAGQSALRSRGLAYKLAEAAKEVLPVAGPAAASWRALPHAHDRQGLAWRRPSSVLSFRLICVASTSCTPSSTTWKPWFWDEISMRPVVRSFDRVIAAVVAELELALRCRQGGTR